MKTMVNQAMDFADVSDDAWYTEAIRWALSEGIAGGYGNGTFGSASLSSPAGRQSFLQVFFISGIAFPFKIVFIQFKTII